MAEDKDDVTPEEKLLNVIQSGGEQQQAPAEKPAAPAPAAPAPAERKPALKVAKAGKAPANKEAPAAEAKEAPAEKAEKPAAAPDPEAAAPVAFSKKKAGASSGIRLINRMLAAGILVLLGLAAFETFMTVRARGSADKPGALQLPEAQVLELTVDEVQSAYSGDIWWRLESVTSAVGGTTTQTKTITVSTTPWQQTMKGHYKLLATSMKSPKEESKAILMDSRDNKMYFVRLGSSFMVEGTEVKLDDLEADRARFSVGGASIELK